MSPRRTAPPTAAAALLAAAPLVAPFVTPLAAAAADPTPSLDPVAGPPSAVWLSRGAMHRLRGRPAPPPAADDAADDRPEPSAPAPRLAPPATPEPAAKKTPAATMAAAAKAAPAAGPKEWARRAAGVTDRAWEFVVVHHTATAAGDVASIHAAHRRRRDAAGNRWRGVGYHFVVGNGRGMPDGSVEPTFRWRGQLSGAHAGDREGNAAGVGVALIGDFTKTDPTPAQLAAVRRLIAHLRAAYDIPADGVRPHSDFVATACPGDRLSVTDLLAAPVAGTARPAPGGESDDAGPDLSALAAPRLRESDGPRLPAPPAAPAPPVGTAALPR